MVRKVVCAHLYLPPIRAGMRDTCMNHDGVLKILFYENLIMLGISL